MALAEGAAFVAALSRYLNSPEWFAVRLGDPVEVRAVVADGSVRFLTLAVLAAIWWPIVIRFGLPAGSGGCVGPCSPEPGAVPWKARILEWGAPPR